MNRVVCFGEIMIRLTAPDGELLLQTPRLRAFHAGSECNVAVALARLGRPVHAVTVLPPNRLGQAAVEELRRHGVDVTRVVWRPGRMGLFFVTPGAVLRPSEILYDRTNSAFANALPDAVDWDAALAGADWLHLSGITPALGANAAAAAQRAVEAATRLGVRVSFDGNFRASLWAQRDVDPGPILRDLMAHAHLAFVEERDIGRMLGTTFDDPDPDNRRATAAEAAFEAFPKLEAVAHTTRVQESVADQRLSADVRTRSRAHHAGPYDLADVVDRIGGGDAFAAGVLHVLADDGDPTEAARFGLALSALKHATGGDFSWSSEADVRALLAGGALDVRR